MKYSILLLYIVQVTSQAKKVVTETKKKVKVKREKQPEKKPSKKKASSSAEGKDLDEIVAIDVTNEDDSDDSNSSDGEGSAGGGSEEEVSLKMDDICALCNSPWVYGFPSDDNDSRQLQEVMIICDGCDGSYHALCVGRQVGSYVGIDPLIFIYSTFPFK